MFSLLGNVADAKLIYHSQGNQSRISPPDGWVRLGKGAFRKVYLSPDRIVYKVAFNYKLAVNNNDDEYNNFLKIRDRKFRGWRIPEVHTFQWRDVERNHDVTVNTMDFIPGVHELPTIKTHWPAFERFGLFDDTTENYVLGHDGYRYIVDMAC